MKRIAFIANKLWIAKEMLEKFAGEYKLKDVKHIWNGLDRKTYILQDGTELSARAASKFLRGVQFDTLYVHPNASEEFRNNIIPLICPNGDVIEYEI
jgi:hypothetical protein